MSAATQTRASVPRYDAAAARNIAEMIRRVSPADYQRLMAKVKRQAGLAGLGQNNGGESTGFWGSLLDMGRDTLATVVDYKLQERQAKDQADQFEAARRAELERQAMLAEQAATQQMEFRNQLALQEQQRQLERAAERSKGTYQWAMYGVAGLLGLWLITRMVT